MERTLTAFCLFFSVKSLVYILQNIGRELYILQKRFLLIIVLVLSGGMHFENKKARYSDILWTSSHSERAQSPVFIIIYTYLNDVRSIPLPGNLA